MTGDEFISTTGDLSPCAELIGSNLSRSSAIMGESKLARLLSFHKSNKLFQLKHVLAKSRSFEQKAILKIN